MKTYKIVYKADGIIDSVLIKAEDSFLALNIFDFRYDYDEIIVLTILN